MTNDLRRLCANDLSLYFYSNGVQNSVKNEGWLGVCGAWGGSGEAGKTGGRAGVKSPRSKEITGFQRNGA